MLFKKTDRRVPRSSWGVYIYIYIYILHIPMHIHVCVYIYIFILIRVRICIVIFSCGCAPPALPASRPLASHIHPYFIPSIHRSIHPASLHARMECPAIRSFRMLQQFVTTFNPFRGTSSNLQRVGTGGGCPTREIETEAIFDECKEKRMMFCS